MNRNILECHLTCVSREVQRNNRSGHALNDLSSIDASKEQTAGETQTWKDIARQTTLHTHVIDPDKQCRISFLWVFQVWCHPIWGQFFTWAAPKTWLVSSFDSGVIPLAMQLLFVAAVLGSIESDCKTVADVFQKIGSTQVVDPVNCCKTGITCSESAVTDIYLNDYNVKNPLPESIGNLTSLVSLDVNFVAAPLPQSFAALTNLKTVRLAYGKITDFSIILGLPLLEKLDLPSNYLKGALPDLTNAKNLKSLVLSGNQLTSLGKLDLPALENLDLSSNKLTGALPDPALLPNLKTLLLASNQFTSIPDTYAAAKNLQKFDISSNSKLTAQLPVLPSSVTSCYIGSTPVCAVSGQNKICNAKPCLTPSLKQQCQLIDTAFTEMKGAYGDKPKYENCCLNTGITCNSENVTEINWYYSYLTGPLSKSLTQLYLEKLDVHYNSLTEIPPEIKNLKSLKSLNIGSNKFLSLPAELSQLPNLQTLEIYSNAYTIALPNPSSAPGFSSLRSCYLSNNVCVPSDSTAPSACSGLQQCSIDAAQDCLTLIKVSEKLGGPSVDTQCCGKNGVTCTSGRVTSLDWSDRYLYKNVPAEIYQLTGLKYVNFSYSTYLTWELTDDMTNLANLETLVLRSSNVNGTIGWLSKLLNLKTFDIGGSKLVGEIPRDIGNLKNLETLTLTGLTGTLPESMQQLTKLKTLVITNGNLNGTIPAWFSNLKSLQTLNFNFQSFKKLETNFAGLPLTSLRLYGNFYLVGKISTLPSLTSCDVGSTNICQDSLNNPPVCKIQRVCTSDKARKQCAVLRSIFEKLSTDVSRYPDPDDCCSDSRIQCNLDGITELSVYGFSGTWPSAVGDLTELRKLTANFNTISMNLPDDFSNLQNLEELTISSDSFGTKVPAEFPLPLTYLSKLRILSLRSTGLVGSLPADIQYMTALESLDLSYNALNGSIPAEIGALTKLKSLLLSGTKFTGNLPSQFRQLEQLQSLDLSNVQVTGPIPNPIARPGFKNLTSCYVSNSLLCFDDKNVAPKSCNIKYQCPNEDTLKQCKALNDAWTSLGGAKDRAPSLTDCCTSTGITCTNNQVTQVSWYGLTGFSESLTFLPALKSLSLDTSNVGVLPSYVKNFTALETLTLRYADVTGGLESVAQIATLKTLDLDGNQLSGPLPAAIGSLKNLQTLTLSNNRITGLTDALASLTALQSLNLRYNSINGTIPDALASITTLQDLDLSRNQITGGIPSGLKDLPNLSRLDLSDNPLDGYFLNPATNPGFKSLNYCVLGGTICPGNDNVIPSVCNWKYICTDNTQKQCKAVSDLYKVLGSSKVLKERCCFEPDIDCAADNVVSVGLSSVSGVDLASTASIWPSLPALQKLTLSYSKLNTTFPQSFFDLPLQDVTLSGNNFVSLQPEFSKFNLTSLDLSSNKFTSAPDFLYKYPALARLSLSSNPLTGPLVNPIENPGFKKLTSCYIYGTLLCADDKNVAPKACSIQGKCPSDAVAEQCKILQSAAADMGSPDLFDAKYCCSNNGVTCQDDKIVSLSLSLSTQLSPKIFQLQSLTSLSVAGAIKGDFPTGFGNLTNLKSLSVSTFYSGSIPEDFQALNLTSLTLKYYSSYSTGSLGGSLDKIAGMRSLKQLDLSGTSFTSVDAFANHPSLESFVAPYAMFQGSNVLSVFATIPTLSWLDLASNRLSGTVPVELSKLPNLRTLILSYNYELYGPLANNNGYKSLSTCTLYTTAICQDDTVTTPSSCYVPLKCGSAKRKLQCEKIRRIKLALNATYPKDAYSDSSYCCGLTSGIAQCDQNDDVIGLTFFESIPGPFPTRFISEFPKVKQLTTLGVGWTGAIPEAISRWTDLTSLTISERLMTGPLPSALFGFKGLAALDLSNVQLKTTFPDFSAFTGLTSLRLSNNGLTGPLPDFLANLTNLTTLDVSSNPLEGPVPFKSLPKLETLYLSVTNINGTFPQGSSFPNLRYCLTSSQMCQTSDLPAPSACKVRQC
ncbi:hypothetical protein EDD86DRAFT_240147 [Gorgonomyces haynaldii]|nr:hypothetical protein EDD86DRAFT_240147 [Gorgonomyces haynaldii]